MSFQNKDMLGISLIEMLKPNIKNNQNDYVIKTLDIVKDGVEAYLELLSVGIFHKNLEIIKLIVEKYITSEKAFADNEYVTAAIGSERGWTDNERKILSDSGYILCGMGNRIMRTETAATVSASIILNYIQ